jgi:hypothetical protein
MDGGHNMMTNPTGSQTTLAARHARTIAVVSTNPVQHVLETVLSASNHDIVLVESFAHAYSNIKRVAPDLIVLCLSSDDPDGCLVLSMLALDRQTSQIPVVTYVSGPGGRRTAGSTDAEVYPLCESVPLSLN